MKIKMIAVLLIIGMSIQAKNPKNVIIMIGDGMGIAQVYAAMIANGNKLNIERCTNTGFSKTYSFSNFTTDSGAGGTAIACGIKTRNYMIGMNPDSTKAESILDIAVKNHLSTGIVVACALSHATPAAFAAHQINRNMYEEIAADYINSDIDVFIGGGRKYFENRADDRNLTEELKKKDYQIAYNLDDLKTIKTGKLAGLLYEDQNPAMPERGKMLPESTSAAIDILKNNKKGFVLMIEGSQIDWACHDNNADQTIKEVLDFDETVGKVLDFAEMDKNTLVIITADHETGGMTLPDGDIAQEIVKTAYSTKSHTGVCVPVYSYGPGSENFRGFMENTSFKSKIEKLLKLTKGYK
jgi:alkaline phosphatase